MATTSPDNIRTPNPTDPYNLVADLAITASDMQTALNRRANTYVGTSAQRIAFTAATEGMIWVETDANKWTYVRRSGAWVVLNPTARGTDVNLALPTDGSLVSTTVTFPTGLFTTAPTVVTQIKNPLGHHQFIQFRTTGLSTSSFNVQARLINTSTSYTLTFDWIAVQ